MALSSKMGILTGGPGTGKTTILQALVKILKMKRAEVQLAAPTGRAAQRMTETTGAGAKTIHRLLAFDPASGKFTVNENDPLKADFIIVDEASMLDTKLASALFRAISPACHLLLVGDVDQLPSVGSGNVLNDLIKIAEQQKKNGETNSIQVTRLNKIFRQGERSGIVSTAHDILNGVKASPPPIANPSQINTELDLHFIHAPDPERCVKAVTRLCQTLLPNWYPWADRLRDIQVLAPLHKGTAGISNLNRVLQTTLNLQEQVLRMGDKQYHVGDKIIQTRNNYDLNIFNGDLGTILDIQPVSGEMLINFNDEHVQLKRSDLIDITTAYAISIHKSQGSEFPIVVIPLLKQHFIMLQRNLIYTAITRGRKKVFLVGDPAAYAMAVANHSSSKRITDLLPKYTAPYTIAG